MDTNKDNNQFYLSNKKSKPKARRKKWEATQLVLPFFIDNLIITDGKK